MTTQENNKLIAEFMDYKFHERSMSQTSRAVKYIPHISELKYHSSWDWLMPVIKKIHKELYIIEITFNLSGVMVMIKQNINGQLIVHGFDDTLNPLKAYYKAIVEFINWYNKNK